MASDSSRPRATLPPTLIVLLFLSLALRLGWALSRPVNSHSIDALPDQREYLSIAQNLLAGNGFEFFDPRFGETVRAFRMPGYPLFLAAGDANVRVARAVQALLDTSTVLAVFLLAEAVFTARDSGEGRKAPGDYAPLAAAALVAFNPFLLFFTALLLSETLFAAMLAWAMVLLIRPRTEIDRRHVRVRRFCGLILLSLAVLVRPSAIALPVVLGVLSAFVNRHPQRAYDDVHVPASSERSQTAPWRIGAIGLLLLC